MAQGVGAGYLWTLWWNGTVIPLVEGVSSLPMSYRSVLAMRCSEDREGYGGPLCSIGPTGQPISCTCRTPCVFCSAPSGLAVSVTAPGNLSAVPTSAGAPITVTITGLDLASSANCVSSGVLVTVGRWPWTLLTCNASQLVVQSGAGGGGALEVSG